MVSVEERHGTRDEDTAGEACVRREVVVMVEEEGEVEVKDEQRIALSRENADVAGDKLSMFVIAQKFSRPSSIDNTSDEREQEMEGKEWENEGLGAVCAASGYLVGAAAVLCCVL